MANTQTQIDPTNNPSYVVLNGYVLPVDVLISSNGEKIIAESKILDGAYVFERVGRKPVDIDFNFTIRATDDKGKYVFGQESYYDFWTGIWAIDSVIPVKNTFLNKIGINNLVVKSVSTMTFRGNTNIEITIKCSEMYNSVSQQQSLIIPL